MIVTKWDSRIYNQKGEGLWFYMFRGMIESGDVAKMKPYAVVTYMIIKSHVSLRTGMAFPSVDAIARKGGISTSQVKRQWKILIDLGYISKTRNGRRNEYILREKIRLKGSGRYPDVIVSFDYIPKNMKAVQNELKVFSYTGSDKDLEYLQIDWSGGKKPEANSSSYPRRINMLDPKQRDKIRAVLDELDRQVEPDDDIPF